jgi:hypothetical protein
MTVKPSGGLSTPTKCVCVEDCMRVKLRWAVPVGPTVDGAMVLGPRAGDWTGVDRSGQRGRVGRRVQRGRGRGEERGERDTGERPGFWKGLPVRNCGLMALPAARGP